MKNLDQDNVVGRDLYIIHHNDMDGRCAAFVTSYLNRGRNYIYVEVDHGVTVIDVKDYIGRDVVLLDYSLPVDDMHKLAITTNSFVWIDHHKTSIMRVTEDMSRLERARGYERMHGRWDSDGAWGSKYSACALAAMYFPDGWEDYNEIPLAIRLVSDRDVWAFEYGDDSKLFHYGFWFTEDSTPSSRAWLEAIHDPTPFISKGEIVQKAYMTLMNEAGRNCGFWVDWMGHKCYAVNSFIRGSEAWEVIAPKADIWISYRFIGSHYAVSLYSTRVDVSEIAKKYVWDGGVGGGHKGAAGFQCGYPPFLMIANARYIGREYGGV